MLEKYLIVNLTICSRYGLTDEEASKRFYIIDEKGLISKSRYIFRCGSFYLFYQMAPNNFTSL